MAMMAFKSTTKRIPIATLLASSTEISEVGIQWHLMITNSSDYEIVKHIMIDIGNELEDLNTRNIFRVPNNLRKLKEDAYTPQLVSIGPLHYGQEKLNPMQKQKLRYLNLFRRHFENSKKGMRKFKGFVEIKEEAIRLRYAEKLSDDIHEEKLEEIHDAVGFRVHHGVVSEDSKAKIRRRGQE